MDVEGGPRIPTPKCKVDGLRDPRRLTVKRIRQELVYSTFDGVPRSPSRGSDSSPPRDSRVFLFPEGFRDVSRSPIMGIRDRPLYQDPNLSLL